MELGLLYEFDCPQPWGGEHPWGQRMAERAAYRDNIQQIVLADKMGFGRCLILVCGDRRPPLACWFSHSLRCF